MVNITGIYSPTESKEIFGVDKITYYGSGRELNVVFVINGKQYKFDIAQKDLVEADKKVSIIMIQKQLIPTEAAHCVIEGLIKKGVKEKLDKLKMS